MPKFNPYPRPLWSGFASGVLERLSDTWHIFSWERPRNDAFTAPVNRLTGVMDLIEASIRKRLPDIIISDTIEMQRKYRCMLWFVETVQFQEFLRTTLMLTAAKQGVGISAVPIIPNADKDLRIERLQPPVTAGLIRFNTTQTTMIEQLQQWPNGAHDDGPDALDMLWQNTLLYAGGGGAGGAGNMQTASASGAGQRSGFRLGGRG
ncbi:phage terminase large subunit [Gemmobacter sp. 24YEA27]|uniref:phage terminase large subunit n=1 Tax=Gemmobacter sp. 24YEA27 TaxID=3040672 RepID=UPI0024B351B8|nr:phage terminase large subunit [Gemmobacter sp. 24YEA27]